ncbi:hypothetical protein B0H14DRAFT_3859347 [Mycena olivaceomarginata]|nr:hypothetical protein B0H14DRAFT_3859347 [Mycena olivaceomarginata]
MSILDFLLVTPTSTNINVAPQSDCVRTLYLKRPCTNVVPKWRSDANARLEVAPASSPEWDNLNLEYPPGVMDPLYTIALPPSPEWDGLQLEYPLEVSHPRDQIEKTSLNPAPPPAPGHTGNAGDAAVGSSAHSQLVLLHHNIEEVQAFPTPLPSIGQTPENNWTEAETAVFGRADPADDEWTDEESNHTVVDSRSKHKSDNRIKQHPRARHWIYTDRSPSPGAVEKIPEFPKGKTRSGRHFSPMELIEG